MSFMWVLDFNFITTAQRLLPWSNILLHGVQSRMENKLFQLLVYNLSLSSLARFLVLMNLDLPLSSQKIFGDLKDGTDTRGAVKVVSIGINDILPYSLILCWNRQEGYCDKIARLQEIILVWQVTECSHESAQMIASNVDKLSKVVRIFLLVSLFCFALWRPTTLKISAKYPKLSVQPCAHFCAPSGDTSLQNCCPAQEGYHRQCGPSLERSCLGVDAFGSCWGECLGCE